MSLKKTVKQYLKNHNVMKFSDSEIELIESIRKGKAKKKKDEPLVIRTSEFYIRENLESNGIAVSEQKDDASFREGSERLKILREETSAFDREHIWAFNSGHTGKDFRGNPKYLFVYINKYRPDIFAYWICSDEDTISQVRSLGFHAVLSDTPEASYLIERTGVCCSEQVKHNVPFTNVKYLNLWHGIGYKYVERSRVSDNEVLKFDLCEKYIKNNSLYLNQMILAVTCKMQEEQFLKDFRISRDQMLRIGYARCTYQKKYEPIRTFDHEQVLFGGLSDDVRIAVYAPTFRNEQGNTFLSALNDLDALYKKCEQNHIRLVFKMHPLMETENGFLSAKKMYEDKPYFLFWDNKYDFYEILDKVDLLIYDYSSIYSDFLIAGTKHYIRYVFDVDEMVEQGNIDSVEEYYQRTSGTICTTFENLLETLDHYQDAYDPEEIEKIYQLQWEYAGDDDFEKTIQFVMDYENKQTEYPTLYSFDIFDTLISRKGLVPESIFYAVQERMMSEGGFPADLVRRYPEIRQNAEFSKRQYMVRTQEQRKSIRAEISMEQIFEKIQEVYAITAEQAKQLMDWEIEEELDAVIPIPEQIEKAKKLKEEGNTVILISDMYLPKNVILKMLEKADSFLAELPLYLSNEYGVLKTSRLLFFEVYRSIKPFYNFANWIHFGDNPNADYKQPRKMNIQPQRVNKLEFSETEQEKAKQFASYDGFQIAAMEARLRETYRFAKADFVIDFVAPILVSYVDWAVRDAIEKGFEILYFVSRDGHPLKRIADSLIQTNGWKIKTEYIYASRRTWRVPSYFDEIDEDFWANYGGNFNGIRSKEKFLRALEIEDEKLFNEMIPGLDLDEIDFTDWTDGQPARNLVPVIRNSGKYRDYLLARAEKQRELSCGYLKQEIDPDKKCAFVEFYGRGYNQKCHNRLWNAILGREENVYYYYARSVLPTEDTCIRYNMTTVSEDLFFMEAIFANMPYKSIEKYERKEGKIVPVIEPIVYDEVLYDAMDLLLPVYAKAYASLGLSDYLSLDHAQFDFCVKYFQEHKEKRLIYENIGSLVDAISMYANKMEFAPPFRMEDIEEFKNKVPKTSKTHSVDISYFRSTENVQKAYEELFQRFGEEKNNLSGGSALSDAEILKSRDYKKKYETAYQRAQILSDKYRDACSENKVENKILIVARKKKSFENTYYTFRKKLEAVPNVSFEYLFTNDAELDEIADACSRARVLVFCENMPEMSQVDPRPETTGIMLSQFPVRLYYKGKNYYNKLYWLRKYRELEFSQNVDLIEVPAESQVNLFITERNLPMHAASKLKGSCITDVYFDASFRADALAQIEEEYPDAKGKKLIVMMPSMKFTNDGSWLVIPDLEELHRLLGDDYFILLDTKNEKNLQNRIHNVLEVDGFCGIKPNKMDTRAAMAAADILVGDTRDVFFESALLEKPVFSLADDSDTIMRSQNICQNFIDFNPFPVVATAYELAAAIKDEASYDFDAIRQFKETYLTCCDGHSSERLIEYICSLAETQETN